MCLTNVGFSLSYDEQEGEFTGVGYKALKVTDKSGRLNYSVYRNNYQVRENGWLVAIGDYGREFSPSNIMAQNGNIYWPGFHIFLEKKDAENYRRGSQNIVKVKFKNVVGFGEQYINRDEFGRHDKPCIIAEKMKIIGVE